MTLLSEIIEVMKDFGGECHLNDLYARIDSHPNDSIRQCLYLYSSDSEAYLGTKDIFKCIHGVSSRKGIWGLKDSKENKKSNNFKDKNATYKNLAIAYLKENGRVSFEELFEHITSLTDRAETGLRGLKETLRDRKKGKSEVFDDDGKYVWLKPTYLNTLKKKRKLFENLKNDSNKEDKYVDLTKLTAKTENYVQEVREGELTERKILSRKRNREVVKQAKIRDEFKCQSCNFYFYNKIVEAHHLTPLSEKGESVIKIEDLITLCPNCHSISHYLLKEDSILYSNKNFLIEKLQELLGN